MAKMAGKLPLGLMVGLGGSLDVFAGTVKRAPVAWQKLDLEWLYRLIKGAAAHRPHDEAAPLRAGSGRGEAER